MTKTTSYWGVIMGQYGEFFFWVCAKTVSMTHKVKTFFFKKTKTWKNHPFNKPFPIDKLEQIDSEIVSLVGKLPFTIQDYHVDDREYAEFKNKFWPGYFYAIGYKDKKIMEHFVSYKLLELQGSDIYIDVASENSPYPAIFRRNLGLKTYSQDLSYKSGVHADRIGSSADNMPIEKDSVDKISLHCAFEHFCHDIDTKFIYELKRVLRPNGCCVVVPLYMSLNHLNVVDPLLNYKSIKFDAGSMVIAETNLGGLFERYYSPSALERILIPNIGLEYKIFRVKIPKSIWQNASKGLDRVRYALCITKNKLV
ncbi:MAG: class I SAM-dependent methyltransferase [Desulfobulbaceae bacterium]|nr:class I SAM-dependent methyltransferase [Desulfobulbaceae bacterium]